MKTRSKRRPRRSRSGADTRTSPARTLPWTAVRWLLALLLLGIGALSRVRYFSYCIHDDAFISFRYARNLVRGEGLVMNPGERVEGFTNFLWTLLVAPVLALDLDPAMVTQILGGILSLLLVLGAFLFSERRLGGGWYSLVAPAFLAGNLAFVMESLSGLETMAFCVLVFGAYVAFLEARRSCRCRPGLWVALCAAATLVRPEGTLVFGVLSVWAALGVLRGEPARRLGQAVAVYVVLLLPFLLWRHAYYDSWLPNTFYTKVGYTLAQLSRGWRYTIHTFAYCMTQPLLVATWLMTGLALMRSRDLAAKRGAPRPPVSPPRDEALAVALLLCTFYILYVTLIGGDYEPTSRFYMPILTLVYLLFQETLRTLVLLGHGRRNPTRVVLVVLGFIGFAAGFAISESRFLTVLNERRWPLSRFEHHRELQATGEWLAQNTSPQALVALSSIGALPYFADRPIIDMMGLTDRHIGRLVMEQMGHGASGHEKGDGAYVLSRRPDIILFDKGHLFDREVGLDEVLNGARGISEFEIARSAELQQLYELRRTRTRAGVLHWFARRQPHR